MGARILSGSCSYLILMIALGVAAAHLDPPASVLGHLLTIVLSKNWVSLLVTLEMTGIWQEV